MMENVMSLPEAQKAKGESDRESETAPRDTALSSVARSLFMQTGDIQYYLLYKELTGGGTT